MVLIWRTNQHRPAHPKGRPYVVLSGAVTLDGKIASKTGDSQISGPEDLRRVHILRSKVDAITVGIGTVLRDDPLLTVRHAKGRNPTRVIVDSRARTPLNSRLVRTAREIPTIICVTSRAPKKRIRMLQAAGAEIIEAGRGRRVNVRSMLRKLHRMGMRRMMLEGGGNLNWTFLRNGLIDEVQLAVSPILVGGTNSKTLVEGSGFEKIRNGVKLHLNRAELFGRELVLIYSTEKT